MIEAVCDCGAVRIECAIAPPSVTECLCTGCQKMGVLWAYYPVHAVKLVCEAGATQAYQRAEKSQDFHFCRTCGCTTHWSKHDPAAEWMGVNARLMDPADRAGAQRVVEDGP